MASTVKRATVERAIGQEIQRRREAAGVGQSALAMYARQFGIPWTRATVAAIELGRKQLILSELAMMLVILKEAGVTNERLTLGDLIPADDSPVDVWPGVQLPLRDARTLLLDSADTRDIRPTNKGVDIRDLQACDPAEQKAAGVLGVPPRAIVDAAYRRWKHSLSQERARRLGSYGGELTTATPRRLQAINGHITRELLDEIRPLLQGISKKTKKRSLSGNRHARKRSRGAQ